MITSTRNQFTVLSQEITMIDKHRGQLRLGFVSPDLCQHPVGRFLVRVLENLGKNNVRRSVTPTE